MSDILVLLMVFFVYHSIENVLYALLVIFISIKVIDAVSYGTSRGNGKLMFVISDNYEEVSANIMKNLKRGVTYLNGEGAYSGMIRKLLCAQSVLKRLTKSHRESKMLIPMLLLS